MYVAYEVVLPVSLVDGFGYEPSAWGFIVWINPLLVTLFQVRLTVPPPRVPSAPKLVVAALLVMGLPYLLLVASHSVLAVVTVVVVFVVGEMLWVPTSQAVVAELALTGSPRRVHGRARHVRTALAASWLHRD